MIKYIVQTNENGDRFWYLNDKLHREGGPAIEWANGNREWWVNDKRHREGGPAIEWVHGLREWWVNGWRHREEGPAVEWAKGHREWWLNGKPLTESEFNARSRSKVESCDGKVVEIDGKRYKLTLIN